MTFTQTKKDLGRYAQDKVHNYLKDVTQAFEIAGLSGPEALACVGALFMRIAATMAVESGISRERWLKICIDVYELTTEAKEENDR